MGDTEGTGDSGDKEERELQRAGPVSQPLPRPRHRVSWEAWGMTLVGGQHPAL